MIEAILSRKSLKYDMKKISVLISCISISVVMTLSIGIIRDSKYESDINEVKNLYGDYDVYIDDLDSSTISNISNDKDIKRINISNRVSDIVDEKSGIKMGLYTYNKDLVYSLKYKLVGSLPMKDDDIVIEKEVLKKIGIIGEDENESRIIGKKINLTMISKEIEDGTRSINSLKRTFTISGVIEKKDKYYMYATNDIGGVKLLAFVAKNNPMALANKGIATIYLENGMDNSVFSNKMMKKYGIDNTKIHPNEKVNAARIAKESYAMKKKDVFEKLFLILVSSLVVYNMLSILMKDMVSQIGTLKALGINGSSIIKMLFIYGAYIYILGYAIGFVASLAISWLSMKISYGSEMILYIAPVNIALSILSSVLPIMINFVILYKNITKMSIVESISKTDRIDEFKLKLSKGFSIKSKILMNNIFRNKLRGILTVLVISATGAMLVIDFGNNAVMEKSEQEGIFGRIWGMSYGKIDKSISGQNNSRESIFYRLDEDVMRQVANLSGVERVEKVSNLDGAYLKVDKKHMSRDFLEEISRREKENGESFDGEFSLLVRGYSESSIKDREKFIDKGNLPKKNNTLIEVLFVNNAYSKIKHSYDIEVINDIEIGDVLNIKVPSILNGEYVLKEVQVRVSGILNKSYAAGQDGGATYGGNPQIILREEDYKKVTGQKAFNTAYLYVDDDNKKLDENIEKIVSKDRFSVVSGKNQESRYFGNKRKSEERLHNVYQAFLVLLVLVNSVFIMKSNVLSRRDEIKILSYLGMDKLTIKSIVLKEGITYGVLGALVGTVVAIFSYNFRIYELNKILRTAGYNRFIGYGLPTKYILYSIILFIFVGSISAAFSFKNMKKS